MVSLVVIVVIVVIVIIDLNKLLNLKINMQTKNYINLICFIPWTKIYFIIY